MDYAKSLETVTKLSAESGSLPVLLSRATQALHGAQAAIARSTAGDGLSEPLDKFRFIIDALYAFDEVVRAHMLSV